MQKPKLPLAVRWSENQEEWFSQKCEAYWRGREKTLAHEIQDLNAIFDSMQVYYWQQSALDTDTPLLGAMATCGKQIQARLVCVTDERSEAIQRLGEYVRRPGRPSVKRSTPTSASDPRTVIRGSTPGTEVKK